MPSTGSVDERLPGATPPPRKPTLADKIGWARIAELIIKLKDLQFKKVAEGQDTTPRGPSGESKE